MTLRLWEVLKPRLAAERMATVYETLERPMPAVLGAMERRGIAIDRAILARLGGEFAAEATRLEALIHEAAGGPFNIGSPKQLGDILFGRMGWPARARPPRARGRRRPASSRTWPSRATPSPAWCWNGGRPPS